jgi:hypothetical protein
MNSQLQNRTHQKQRMPKVPAPRCGKCGHPMLNVRMGQNEPVGNSTRVNCLAICGMPDCKTEHRGERILDLRHGRMKFLSQKFWVDEKAVQDRKKQEMQREVAAEVAQAKEKAKRYLPWIAGASALLATIAVISYVV